MSNVVRSSVVRRKDIEPKKLRIYGVFGFQVKSASSRIEFFVKGFELSNGEFPKFRFSVQFFIKTNVFARN